MEVEYSYLFVAEDDTWAQCRFKPKNSASEKSIAHQAQVEYDKRHKRTHGRQSVTVLRTERIGEKAREFAYSHSTGKFSTATGNRDFSSGSKEPAPVAGVADVAEKEVSMILVAAPVAARPFSEALNA